MNFSAFAGICVLVASTLFVGGCDFPPSTEEIFTGAVENPNSIPIEGETPLQRTLRRVTDRSDSYCNRYYWTLYPERKDRCLAYNLLREQAWVYAHTIDQEVVRSGARVCALEPPVGEVDTLDSTCGLVLLTMAELAGLGDNASIPARLRPQAQYDAVWPSE